MPLTTLSTERLSTIRGGMGARGANNGASRVRGTPGSSLADLKDVLVQGTSTGLAYEACWGLASIAMGGTFLLQPEAAPAWMPWALKGTGAACSVAAGWATRHYLMK